MITAMLITMMIVMITVANHSLVFFCLSFVSYFLYFYSFYFLALSSPVHSRLHIVHGGSVCCMKCSGAFVNTPLLYYCCIMCITHNHTIVLMSTVGLYFQKSSRKPTEIAGVVRLQTNSSLFVSYLYSKDCDAQELFVVRCLLAECPVEWTACTGVAIQSERYVSV